MRQEKIAVGASKANLKAIVQIFGRFIDRLFFSSNFTDEHSDHGRYKSQRESRAAIRAKITVMAIGSNILPSTPGEC